MIYTRRTFIGQALAGLGSATLLLACGDPARTGRFFTVEEAALVDALVDSIIPPDDAPGAREAGVGHFIDRQLLGPYKRFQPAYRSGLEGVQQTSRTHFGRPFEALSIDEQTTLLHLLESDEAPGAAWAHASSARFFHMLVAHTMQGFYGPPRHGGNRFYASYAMLGLDYPPIVGRHRPPG